MDLTGKRRVLVVDDDGSIRLLLLTFLRSCGFESLAACNGREALALMRAGRADIVIMDLMMPVVSGWEVLRERAADPALGAIPVIVLTAKSICQVTPDMLGLDVYAVLAKPFDLQTVLSAVSSCLAQPVVPLAA